MPKGTPKVITQQEITDTLASALDRSITVAQTALKELKKFERQPKPTA
jgi:hypothetical protein